MDWTEYAPMLLSKALLQLQGTLSFIAAVAAAIDDNNDYHLLNTHMHFTSIT